MRALVFGGNGFIGSHLVDALLASGHQVRVFDRSYERFRPALSGVDYRLFDFKDSSAIAESLEGVDVVIHLLSTTVPSTSNLDVVADIESNLIGTVRLLQLMLQKEVKRIVYLSSGGTAYGVPQIMPIPETHPLNPICSYGVVKVAVEKYLLMFQQLYGLRPVILRPANPYGDRQGHGGVQGVINTFLARIKNCEKIEIWGDGSTVRDFIHVEDLADICRIAAETEIEGVFNVGSGSGCSILEIMNVLRAVTGREVSPVFKPGRNYDVPRVVLDISKTEEQLDWRPRIDLYNGVAKTWQWIQDVAY